jgi:hypothetical protein
MTEKTARSSSALRRYRFIALMVIAVLLASLACIPGSATAPATSVPVTSAPVTIAPVTSAPPPAASEEATGGKEGTSTGGEQPGGEIVGGQSSGGGNVTLTVINSSASTVCYMRISPTTSSTWGDDWLGSDTIASGASYNFTVPSGSYDLRAEFCGGGDLVQWNVSLATNMTWTLTGGGSSGGGNASLTVINNATSTVCFMRISPTTSSVWGDDWLGSSTIPSGGSYTFSVPSGSYDLRAEFCGGGDATEMGVSIAGAITWTLTGTPSGSSGGGTGTLMVVNNTSSTVCYMRISPTTSSVWGDDWLGSTTIPSGGSYNFNVPAGSYDLRAEFCGGGEATEMGVNISGSMTWTLTGSAPSTGALDYTLTPNFGSVTMGSGFVPDPYTVRVMSGGTVDLGQLNISNRCTGYASSAPDFRILWTGGGSRLRIYFIADTPGDDATLIVNSAAANWRCRDDYSATVLNPFVEITNPLAGQYDIWVGSYWSGEYISGTLYITELSGHP